MYELFEHTADLGLRVTAPDLDALFAEAAACLLSATVEDPASVRPNTAAIVNLVGDDREFLLFDWLRELLMRFELEQMLFSRFDVRVRPDGLTATIYGEPYDPARHALSREVKAITYHDLKVTDTGRGWLAEVIVDI